MVAVRDSEYGIDIIGDEDHEVFFIFDDDFAFIISKMVERMDKRLKGEIPDYP